MGINKKGEKESRIHSYDTGKTLSILLKSGKDQRKKTFSRKLYDLFTIKDRFRWA